MFGKRVKRSDPRLVSRLDDCERRIGDFSKIIKEEIDEHLKKETETCQGEITKTSRELGCQLTNILNETGKELVAEQRSSLAKAEEKIESMIQEKLERMDEMLALRIKRMDAAEAAFQRRLNLMQRQYDELQEMFNQKAVQAAIMEELMEEVKIGDGDETPVTFTFFGEEITFPVHFLNKILRLKAMHAQKKYTVYRSAALFRKILLLLTLDDFSLQGMDLALIREMKYLEVDIPALKLIGFEPSSITFKDNYYRSHTYYYSALQDMFLFDSEKKIVRKVYVSDMEYPSVSEYVLIPLEAIKSFAKPKEQFNGMMKHKNNNDWYPVTFSRFGRTVRGNVLTYGSERYVSNLSQYDPYIAIAYHDTVVTDWRERLKVFG